METIILNIWQSFYREGCKVEKETNEVEDLNFEPRK